MCKYLHAMSACVRACVSACVFVTEHAYTEDRGVRGRLLPLTVVATLAFALARDCACAPPLRVSNVPGADTTCRGGGFISMALPTLGTRNMFNLEKYQYILHLTRKSVQLMPVVGVCEFANIHTHTHTRTHSQTHAHTHMRAQAHTHTRTHARTHAHTQT